MPQDTVEEPCLMSSSACSFRSVKTDSWNFTVLLHFTSSSNLFILYYILYLDVSFEDKAIERSASLQLLCLQ